jgi:hypothetical protein
MQITFGYRVGRLTDVYGYRMVYDAGSAIGLKLSYIIRGGNWYWPNAIA